jgi:hypothetical protein
MLFNEMQLKVYYEMKREEMEKAILASKYSKNNEKVKFYRKFFNLIKEYKKQKKYVVPKSNCCDIKIQQVCCEN